MRKFRKAIQRFLMRIVIWVYPAKWEIEDMQEWASKMTTDFITKDLMKQALMRREAEAKIRGGKYDIN